MSRQGHCAIGLDLHTLVAAERLKKIEIEFEPISLRHQQVANLLAIRVFTIGSEAHHLAFIAIFAVADEFANHGIEAAQRMRQEDAIQHLYVISFTTCHHRGDEISRAVIAEPRGLLPRRTVVRAGNVSNVVLKMVLSDAE